MILISHGHAAYDYTKPSTTEPLVTTTLLGFFFLTQLPICRFEAFLLVHHIILNLKKKQKKTEKLYYLKFNLIYLYYFKSNFN